MAHDEAKEALDEALAKIHVGEVNDLDDTERPDDAGREPDLGGWFYVCDDDGIIAYFAHEVDALRFRLAEVNRHLNG